MYRSLVLVLFAALLLMTSWASSEKCVPGDNCRSASCRCWNDKKIPGGLNRENTPQIILVSFSYAINSANVANYKKVLEGLTNPNGYEPKATFFIQGHGTDFNVVADLHRRKHEIGVSSDTGALPDTLGGWMQSYNRIRDELKKHGIEEGEVQGARSPSLYFGGDSQVWGMGLSGLSYDSTCVTSNYSSQHNLLWPYTLDFAHGSPSCTIGKTMSYDHPGKWEFLMPVLKFKDIQCPTPSACTPLIKDTADAFELFFVNFKKHYDGNRSPFIMYLDPLWLTNEHRFRGTQEFLMFALSAFKGTWVVTYQQTLEWMKDPVPWQNATSFGPWNK